MQNDERGALCRVEVDRLLKATLDRADRSQGDVAVDGQLIEVLIAVELDRIALALEREVLQLRLQMTRLANAWEKQRPELTPAGRAILNANGFKVG